MANQNLVFDVTKQGIEQEKQQYITSRVGDGGLKGVTITVLSNQKPYDITGLTPVFEGVKPDGTKIIDDKGFTMLNPKQGVFKYTMPHQASAVEGEYSQSFFSLKRGNQTDSTLEIKINVLPNTVEYGINSESYLTSYQDMVQQLKAAQQKALDALETQADATDIKVKGNETLADTLRRQLTQYQSSINDGNMVTQEQLKSEVSAVSDLVEKMIRNLKDTKSSMGQSIDNIQNSTVSSHVSSTPIQDVAQITETGYYYYRVGETQNIPVLNNNNTDGYIHAVMRDNQNGMIEILGSGYTREKYRGQLHERWLTNKPVRLWSGEGKSGSKLALRGPASGFGYLVFDVEFETNKWATIKIRKPEVNNSIFLDSHGLKTGGNVAQSILEEVALILTDDTHISIGKVSIAKDGNSPIDSSKITILNVWGVL